MRPRQEACIQRAGRACAALLACASGLGLAAQGNGDPGHAFHPIDVDGDGVAEIEAVASLREVGDRAHPLVAIAVEPRLLRSDAGAPAPALRARLDRFADDVAAAGFRAVLLEVAVHRGPPHQDGRTVLGLRRLFQQLHTATPMAGAVLVGHFPDALLVRTCNWRRNEPLQLPGKDGAQLAIAATTTNVRCVPEIVAHRCDVVLADLDGDWEGVYLPGPASLPSVTAVFGDTVPEAGGAAVAMATGELKVVDVFHVRDGAAVVDAESFAVRLDAADRDRECAASDRALGNPLAQPELAVSRIDALGVALSPDPRGLDVAGRPTVFTSAGKGGALWHVDPALELQLLIEYFDRNHAWRTQPLASERRRPASISHGLGSGLDTLRAADPAWREFAADGYDVHQDPSLVSLLQWLQRPAVVRTLRVHSDPWGGAFAGCAAADLTRAAGLPWHWQREGDRLVPSWQAHCPGRADFAFYRTLWQHQLLGDNGYLLIHTGCEALSPPGCVEHAYDDSAYGQRAHAESMLFFTPCLAMVGRAKVFYDEPRGFTEALGAGETFGRAWQRYFAIEGAAKSWAEVGDDIGRKRAYFWSLVGDWTLRLPKGP